jgi:hypothetical protein
MRAFRVKKVSPAFVLFLFGFFSAVYGSLFRNLAIQGIIVQACTIAAYSQQKTNARIMEEKRGNSST